MNSTNDKMQDTEMYSHASVFQRPLGNKLFSMEHLKSMMVPISMHIHLMEVCKSLTACSQRENVCVEVGEWTCIGILAGKAPWSGVTVF